MTIEQISADTGVPAKQVRKVLEAIRAPSDPMIRAMQGALYHTKRQLGGYVTPTLKHSMRFVAAIDTLLKAKP